MSKKWSGQRSLKRWSDSPTAPSWPFGTNGALNVAPGGSVNIINGSNRDYTSVTIGDNATLNIVYNSNDGVTVIGCQGNWTMGTNAQIIGSAQNNLATTITKTAPDGYSFSYSPAAAAGGAGGNSATNLGGAAASGNAGGGAGTSGDGFSAMIDTGGDGGAAGGGGAGEVYGENGGAGSLTGGGGGATRGYAGACVYIKILGTISVGSGSSINLSGTNGGVGGVGSVATGGGGGGAGGFGGKLVTRTPIPGANVAASYVLTGGSGGAGGVASVNGVSGTAGGNGQAGVLDQG